MLFHPHTLNLLQQFKQSLDVALLKEILSLLIDSECKIDIKDLYNIIFSHTKITNGKSENIKLITGCIENDFNIPDEEVALYTVKDFENLNSETVKLIKKRRNNLIKKGKTNKKSLNGENLDKLDVKSSLMSLFKSLKDVEMILNRLKNESENVSVTFYKNRDILLSCINTIISIYSQNFKNGNLTKLQYSNFINSIKIESKLAESNTSNRQFTTSFSLLNFVTKEKRKTVEQDDQKRFSPIVFDNNVYVYKLNNPNFVSLRRRKDLVNPKKMTFIKFAEDLKPPIYCHSENRRVCKFSHKKIFNDIDYDEESTWEEDDSDGESIDSDDTEEEDSSSGNNEFVEVDSGEQERKSIKKPVLIFSTVKIEFNKEYDSLWRELPLVPTKTINDKIKEKIKSINYAPEDLPAVIKKLSRTFMVVENSLKEYFDTL